MGYNNFGGQYSLDGLDELDNYDVRKDERNLVLDDVTSESGYGDMLIGQTDEVSFLADATVIDGNIKTEKAISLSGRLNGDLETESDAAISGLVSGNVSASSIRYNHAAVRGNSKADFDIIVEDGSVIVGDLSANNVDVNGKVKGHVDATHRVEFKDDALLVGSVSAGAIHMEDGARVDATITLTNQKAPVIYDDEFDLEV